MEGDGMDGDSATMEGQQDEASMRKSLHQDVAK